MSNDLTVIYYTSNLEDEEFEHRIQSRLLSVSGDIPIISVSLKPIVFGKNICLGEHEPNDVMLHYQLLVGCMEAKTPFIITAESDFLYPPEYFSFKPPKEEEIYYYRNIRLAYSSKWGFFKKKQSEGAKIAGREYLIGLLTEWLKDFPCGRPRSEWPRKFNPTIPHDWFGGRIACVTWKTGNGLRKTCGVERERSIRELPYWGSVDSLREELFGTNCGSDNGQLRCV